MAQKINLLFNYMASVSDAMAKEYEMLRALARDDPGTAGDQGEENWREVLEDWLPSEYKIAQKGK